MKYFSMFSGIGGFELGIKRTGKERWECVGFSEVDKYAKKIYRKHFPNHKDYGDATKINPDKIDDFDLLCGGFPCQAFSIAGKRLGFEDTRGTLFFEIAKIVKVRRPQFLFLENVKGLLSHDNGRTFTVILATLHELGYDAEWEVLNSKNFGVPQNRERIFIIGHLRGKRTRQVFPLGQDCREDVEQGGKEQEGRSWISTLDSRYGQRWSQETYVKEKSLIKKVDGQQGARIYHTDGISQFERRIRRLTPIECEALQGFPKNWTEYGKNKKGKQEQISDSQRYKCLGNAVTVNVIESIMGKLIKENIELME